MVGYYDEVEIEDMTWDEDKGVYHYPCPCGDRFEISRNQLAECEDIATCPSCSLIIRVVYDPLDFEEYLDENEDDSGESEEEPKEKEDEDEDEDHFEDALENFKISDDDSLHSAGQVAKVMA